MKFYRSTPHGCAKISILWSEEHQQTLECRGFSRGANLTELDQLGQWECLLI